MIKKFEILPHMADTRLKVSSDTVDGLFSGALEGMNRIICRDYIDENSGLSEIIETASIDETMLLIDFLSDVLTLSHKNKCVYSISEIREISKTKIQAVLRKLHTDHFDEDIKGVTYTEAKIVKNSEGILETIIVFDI